MEEKKRKRGRPKGSTKPNKKLQYNFKLSIEERIAVDSVLDAMRVKTPPPDIWEHSYCNDSTEILEKLCKTGLKELFVIISDSNSKAHAVCKCPIIEETKKKYIIKWEYPVKVDKSTLKIESHNNNIGYTAFRTSAQAFTYLLEHTYQNDIMLRLMAVRDLELHKIFFETIRNYGYVAALELAARYFKMDIFNLYSIEKSPVENTGEDLIY